MRATRQISQLQIENEKDTKFYTKNYDPGLRLPGLSFVSCAVDVLEINTRVSFVTSVTGGTPQLLQKPLRCVRVNIKARSGLGNIYAQSIIDIRSRYLLQHRVGTGSERDTKRCAEYLNTRTIG